MKLEVEYMDKNDLKPYANNAKIHTAEQVEQIKRSIEEFGFNDPIAIWGDNEVVEGHGRLIAIMEMDDIKTVPVIRLDHLSNEERKAYALVHNKLTLNTDYSPELLELELLNLEIDLSEFGFIDDLSVPTKETQTEKTVKEMQLKAFEHYDYIVFVFKNQMDWLNILTEFEVERVNAGYGKTRKIGIGRVLDGARLLEKLGHQNSDFESWESNGDFDDTATA